MIRQARFSFGALGRAPGTIDLASLGTTVLGTLLIAWSLEQVHFATSAPSRFALGLALAALALGWRAAALPAVGYVVLGALSLAWSLAPGHTLRAIPWELLPLVGFVLGRQRGAPWTLGVLVGTLGSSSLALYAFDLQMYLSGTPLYLAGAVSAAALVLLWNPLHHQRRIGWALRGVLAGLPLFLVVVSGSRAVYLGALVAIALLIGHVLLHGGWRRALALATSMAIAGLVATTIQLAMPKSQSVAAMGGKATVAAQTEVVSEYGVLSQRLRFWRQALDIALAHPAGAGAGSFTAVVHAHQRFPMVWSSSPHNVFFETLATGGWPRLVVLVGLIFWAVVRAVRRGDVAAAAAAMSIWIFLSFDVAAYYPGFLALAFLLTGMAWGRIDREEDRASTAIAVGTAIVASAAGIAFLWWNVDCATERCVLSRKLGAPSDVVAQLDRTPEGDKAAFLARTQRLYPKSLWVVQLREQHAQSVGERLAVRREIVERFPLQHPENYTRLAESAIASGRPEQAEAALREGLAVFPPERPPFSEMRYSTTDHARWVERARALLAELEQR